MEILYYPRNRICKKIIIGLPHISWGRPLRPLNTDMALSTWLASTLPPVGPREMPGNYFFSLIFLSLCTLCTICSWLTVSCRETYLSRVWQVATENWSQYVLDWSRLNWIILNERLKYALGNYRPVCIMSSNDSL